VYIKDDKMSRPDTENLTFAESSEISRLYIYQNTGESILSLLTLPDDVLVKIGQNLHLHTAIVFAQTCRRLHEAFPAILPSRGDYYGTHTQRLCVRRLDDTMLSSMSAWMRVYNVALNVDNARITLSQRWLMRNDDSGWLRLGLSEHNLETIAVAVFGKVHTLNLCKRNITDVGTTALGNVHTLNLSYVEVADLGSIAPCNAHTLDLRYTKVTDVGVPALGKVHVLKLCNTGVTDVGSTTLCSAHTLDLSYTKNTDAGASKLCCTLHVACCSAPQFASCTTRPMPL
jgi:hypothetical protein